MKHLKTYENLIKSENISNLDNINNLKKYVVFFLEYDDILEILEVGELHMMEQWFITRFEYDNDNDKFVEITNENSPNNIITNNSSWIDITNEEDLKCILYTSDSIEDCKEFIKLKTTANKYNL